MSNNKTKKCTHGTIMERDGDNWAPTCLHVIQGAKIFSDINEGWALCAFCLGGDAQHINKYCRPVCMKCVEGFAKNN